MSRTSKVRVAELSSGVIFNPDDPYARWFAYGLHAKRDGSNYDELEQGAYIGEAQKHAGEQ